MEAEANVHNDSKTIYRDSWHKFSTKKKSHSWCDFTPSSTIFDSKLGFLSQNDSILITANILVLHEFEDAGPSILFVYSLCSMSGLKPRISVELSWSLVTEKGVMSTNQSPVTKLTDQLGLLSYSHMS
uniref:Uncharacterized protein n=1 Tax=Quercus lobata TaxID=97700 RepID=A0A7N2R3F5_QUELO